MFKPPSMQREYTLCSSIDPALNLPDVPDVNRDTDPPELVKKAEAAAEERSRLFRKAQADGQWMEITKPGDKPTIFKVRQIHGPVFQWLMGEQQRRSLSLDESYELAFRLGVRGVENFGAVKLEHEVSGGFKMLTRKSLERFYDVGHDVGKPALGALIVLEIGALILTRAIEGCPPLS